MSRVPSPDIGATVIGESYFLSSEGVTPPSSLLRTHAPVPLVLLSFGLSFVRGVFAGCYQPRLPAGPSRRYLCESFLACLVPCHGGPTGCACLFLPRCHRPSPTEVWVGFPLHPRTRFSAERFSTLQTFLNVQASEFARLPDRSYRCAYHLRAAESFTSGHRALRCLRAHRIC